MWKVQVWAGWSPLCPARPPGAEVCPTSGTVWWSLPWAEDPASPEHTGPSWSPDAPSSCNNNTTPSLLTNKWFHSQVLSSFCPDSLLPFVDLLFNIFCTECFHLEIDSAGLQTHNSRKIMSLFIPLSAETETRGAQETEKGKTWGLYLPGVLGARLQGDGARQVQRNLRTQPDIKYLKKIPNNSCDIHLDTFHHHNDRLHLTLSTHLHSTCSRASGTKHIYLSCWFIKLPTLNHSWNKVTEYI